MKKFVLAMGILALGACSSDVGGDGGGGTAKAGDPCKTAGDCAEGLACKKDADGDFVCQVEEETSDVGKECASADDCSGDLLCLKVDGTFVCTTEDGGGTGTDGGTTDGGTDGPDIDDCPQPAPSGAICNPFCNLGCDDDTHCTWNGGGFGCVSQGSKGIGEVCSQSANDCNAGMACILITGEPDPVCRQFCIDDNDCPEGRPCSQGINFPGGANATFCGELAVGCNVFDQSTCTEEGQACYLTSNFTATKCMEAGELEEGTPCAALGDNSCKPGLQCMIECTAVCSYIDVTDDEPKCSEACEGASFIDVNEENGIAMCLTDTPPSECDLYAQTGCGAGQGCYPTNIGWRCLNAGGTAAGGTCQFTNNCSPWTLCVNSLCQEPCSVKEDAPAEYKCEEICASFNQLNPAEWGVGFCTATSTCGFWAQDCEDATQNCYVTGSAAVCMDPGANGDAGASCQQPNDCAKGLVCAQGKCIEVCSIDELQPPPTPICVDDCPGGAFTQVSVDAQIGTCDE